MTKRGAPAHVQKPTFVHPAAGTAWITILEKLPDPRGGSPNFRYSLTSILFIVTATMLCGAEDWEEMSSLAEGMQEWLSHYVDMSSGIPSAFTIERVISSIEPTSLESMLREIAQLFRQKLTDDIIAIDGKTLCGSRDKSGGQKGVHLLHAWSCDNRICLAQLKVDDKSNEITSICSLLDQLFLEGSIVTADALNTQKNTTAKIIEKGAHYVLPVKENQRGLLESIQTLFTRAENDNFIGADHFESLEKSRGRVEERLCIAIDASELVEAKEWAGLKTAAKIVRRRTLEGKTSEEVIYYISDLDIDATKIARAAREHWGVENGLHYALDVVLGEDSHIYRNRNGARNLSVVRKIVLTALEKTETKKKKSKKTKRLLAALDSDFRTSCLKNLF
jgi:predicted transposase YbfD/YdcC